jgi:hydrogenase expression/formation protein HypE
VGLLGEIVQRMGQAARQAGVRIVTGDTKVVERGAADQMFINTAGVGVMPAGVELGPGRIEPGDVILLSGTIADHGLAIMSLREGLEFEAPIESDCQPLHEMAAMLLGRPGALKMMRDATRGGVAAVLNEMAQAAELGFELEEERVPVKPVVAAACEMLGLDPLYVANEGKFVAIVAPEAAGELLAGLRKLPGGENAVVAGKVERAHRGVVRLRTKFGTRRVVPMPLGEQLPRIC